ncbi:hypothetical protein V6M85_08110 [Sulfolobus tengchongensis]|uniref:Membrane protein 6-pyruvoyl-tetrahydropterin synthase-related domain-containing protein n=1 Tax=Sulfolobus tengchongensis TaxID=207809 RepID=A0AAX4KZQ4_9CREN
MEFKITWYRFKHADILILFLIDLLLSIDFSRLGNVYTIDDNIFPYYNTQVAYKYLIMSIYGYNPWTGQLGGFSLSNFLVNYPVYLFSNIPFSYTFYSLFMIFIGSILVYLTIKEILRENSLPAILASLIGSIFFIINLSSGGIYSTTLEAIYLYYLALPASIFVIRKYFTSDNFSSSLIYFFFLIITMALLYYYAIPVYALSTFVLLFSIILFYSIRSLIDRKVGRVLLLLLSIIGFILIRMSRLLAIYSSFSQDKSFIEISFYYWVTNSYGSPLYLTLRGINANFGLPPLYIYLSTLFIPILYLFILFNKKTRRNGETLLFLFLILIFAFLYSMPNVPFSSFWEKLFFEFPIMTDIRTQYVLVAPFLGSVMSYGVGFGVYAILEEIKRRRIYLKALAVILIIVAVFLPAGNVLVNGGNYIIVPYQFLKVVNFINDNSNYNSSVIVFPIFPTENSEIWYHGPSLFPLFLKPYVILGGGYYSPSPTAMGEIATFYNYIYLGNSNATRYVSNFIYLFNIHYIIVEKTAAGFGPLGPCPSGFNVNQLENGTETYEKLGLLKLVYNNSLYEVLKTNVSSSLVFIGFENYTIQNLLNSTDLSAILTPADIKYISPIEYMVNVNSAFINNTVYLYFTIPYSQGWEVRGAEVYNYSDWYGYTLFKLKPINNTLILYNSLPNSTFSAQKTDIVGLFVLPSIIGTMLLILNRKFKVLKISNKYL